MPTSPIDLGVFRGLIQGKGVLIRDLSSLASGGSYELTVEEAKYSFIKFTGQVTGAVTVLFPAVAGLGWHVWNAVTHTDTSGQILIKVGAVSIPLVDGVIGTIVVDDTPAPRPVGIAPANPASVAGPVGVLLGSPMPPSWVRINIVSGTTAVTLTDSQASAQFIEFHNANAGLVNVTFPAAPGHVWFGRCASDSVFAVRCKSLGDTGPGVDINPGYDAILMIDSTGNVTNGALVRHGSLHDLGGLDPVRHSVVIVLAGGETPGATGPDSYEAFVPYSPADGVSSVVWNVRSIEFRVATAGGAPSARVERSTVDGAFSAATVGDVTLASGANQNRNTTSLGTVASASKLRYNALVLGTATGWSVSVMLEKLL